MKPVARSEEINKKTRTSSVEKPFMAQCNVFWSDFFDIFLFTVEQQVIVS